MKIVHYKASGRRRKWPACLETKREGALTNDQWVKYPGPATITDISRVTCVACLKQIVFDINNRLGK